MSQPPDGQQSPPGQPPASPPPEGSSPPRSDGASSTSPADTPAAAAPAQPGDAADRQARSAERAGRGDRITDHSRLAMLDRWMGRHPAHPRIVPFVVFVLLLFVVNTTRDYIPLSYPFLYTLKCLLVAWLIWRYRHLMPEINLRFHWIAIPAAVVSAAGWIMLAWWMAGEFDLRWAALLAGNPEGRIPYEAIDREPGMFTWTAESFFAGFLQDHPVAAWSSLILRLIGMTVLVAIFEEVLFRSFLLRAFHRWRDTRLAVVQLASDLPIIGDMIIHTRAAKEAEQHRGVLRRAFENVPLGALSINALIVGAILWCLLSHIPRDWPGTVLCVLTFSAVLALTARRGLGPVIWAHALTNALLWAYVVWSHDWQFLG